jgi:hypothetical protein
MNVVSGPSLFVEDIPKVHELPAVTLRKQAQVDRTDTRAVFNRINQMLEKSRHQ